MKDTPKREKKKTRVEGKPKLITYKVGYQIES